MDMVSIYGFAGGFELGATQAGLRLIEKLENAGGFGMANCRANRHLLGDVWPGQTVDPSEWKVKKGQSPIVIANPPCSGFSSMSWGVNRATYGMKAKINSCMWDTVNTAAQIAPEILIMESVQAAAVNGLPLMRQLRERMEQITGYRYHMYHVLQNNGALGGCSIRRRYFLVLARVPFGIDPPAFGPPATLRDAIGDLEPLRSDIMQAQKYRAPASDWVKREGLLNPAGRVDGHCTADMNPPGMARLLDLMKGDTDEVQIWPQNRCLVWALRTYYQTHGHLPDSWHFKRQSGVWADESLIAKNFEMGFTRPKRWVYDLPSRVVIGGAMWLVVHPEQDRMLTHRECARIIGFPDTWVAEPLAGMRGLEETWGKGVSVGAGRWIAGWAKAAVEGRPGELTGVPVADHPRLAGHGPCERETVIDVSKVPKAEYPVYTKGGYVYSTVVDEDGEAVAA